MNEVFKENDISRELMDRSDPNKKLFTELFWVYLSYIVQTYFVWFRRKSLTNTQISFFSNRGISSKTRISREHIDQSGSIEMRLQWDA